MMRYHYEKPNIYLSMYGKVYFVTIQSIIAARCSKSEKRDWQLFSRDLTRKQRVPGGGDVDPWITDDLYFASSF